MEALKRSGAGVVNFEDEGEGASLADLVVNALYSGDTNRNPCLLYGHKYFCLRDEFVHARRNIFRAKPQRLLITFGGTDASDYTRQCLEALWPLCREREISVRIVAGPGYAHKESLAERLIELSGELSGELSSPWTQETDPDAAPLSFTHATNVMSREMENADMAVCSAGRTVYELAHMRIPAIVLAHNEREQRHCFARAANGFIYLGLMRELSRKRLCEAFARMLDPVRRQELFRRQDRFDFSANKARLVEDILRLLPPRE